VESTFAPHDAVGPAGGQHLDVAASLDLMST